MGYTIYYKVYVRRWREFIVLIRRACSGLGLRISVRNGEVMIIPNCGKVEPLRIPKKGEGFVKTNLVEPYHSVYTLILYSISSFGDVSVWED
ncbi:TonB-dependent receptor [Thermococcus sp.]